MIKTALNGNTTIPIAVLLTFVAITYGIVRTFEAEKQRITVIESRCENIEKDYNKELQYVKDSLIKNDKDHKCITDSLSGIHDDILIIKYKLFAKPDLDKGE